MKFGGQVRIPDVDHPGVPATFLIEDDQAELVMGGDSLGRWSLFDVHTSRLLSAAFSVTIDDEEITFIADEPVDFAYKGVDYMAEVWARFKAMSLPRRKLAVKRSRNGTLPTRFSELRAAMLENLEEKPVATPSYDDVNEGQPAAPPPAAQIPAPVDEVVPAPVEDPEPVVFEEVEVVEPIEAVEPAAEAPVPPRAVLRPGPGLMARATPASVSELPVVEQVPLVDPVPVVMPEPEPVAEVVSEPVAEVVPEPEPEVVPEPEPEPVAVAEADTTEEPGLEELLDKQPAPGSEEPSELMKELLGTSAGDSEGDAARDLVVDLGEFEQGTGAPSDEPGPAPDSDREPALSSAAPADKSGLFGAVRNAFVRNKTAHVHEFVEAPGGIGIVRQICSECGFVSIGVSDD